MAMGFKDSSSRSSPGVPGAGLVAMFVASS
jgi:hypothetical protein